MLKKKKMKTLKKMIEGNGGKKLANWKTQQNVTNEGRWRLNPRQWL